MFECWQSNKQTLTSNTELFIITVNCSKPLTFVTKIYIYKETGVLDCPVNVLHFEVFATKANIDKTVNRNDNCKQLERKNW